jgi:hypothetical protein
MLNLMGSSEIEKLVTEHLQRAAGVVAARIDVRAYPNETNFVVYVEPHDFEDALREASDLDDLVRTTSDTSFVVIRKLATESAESDLNLPMKGVHDQRSSSLIRLVGARSRVSSVQPRLVYVEDARASIEEVTAERHHLIFGRRGAGKSALLVEARRVVEDEGSLTSWSNMQTLRKETPQRIFLYVIRELLEQIVGQSDASRLPTTDLIEDVLADVGRLLYAGETSEADAVSLVPKVQRSLSRRFQVSGQSSFVFLDDFYFLPRDNQPQVLELLHACSRDSSVWLKIGSIKHLTNWWQATPPLGLQTGQDTGIIELDATLQRPAEAREFLVGVLGEYARRVGIRSISGLFPKGALDRLVLASGAVPRDFLVLAADSVVRARRRASARFVGIQDVNEVAGDAASVKIQELEEDMASNSGEAERTLATLNAVKEFCLHTKQYTYFLVGYRDREDHPELYGQLTDLMDVRLVHIVEPSVSDPHIAGQRSEAFMLDLSQYTGTRFKQNLVVLDFNEGKFQSRATKGKDEIKVGSTSRELISILRGAPAFELASLAEQN